jgi:hypothetical protein
LIGTNSSPGAQSFSSIKKSPPLPEANFTDRAGFSAYVAKLRTLGLSEPLAKWLAISAKVRADLPGSLAFAKGADLLREWAAAVAVNDPEGGFDLVRSQRNASDVLGSMGQGGPLGTFFQTLGSTAPELGMTLLRRLSGFEAANASGLLFGAWAKNNPDAAMEAAVQLQPLRLQEGALSGLLREWGKRNLHGMMTWATARSPRIARLAFQSQFDMSAAGVDPREMLKIAREFPTAVEPGTLGNTAGKLSAQGVKGWSAIAEFPAGKLRDWMAYCFATRLSGTDPKGAWDLAKTMSPEDQKSFLTPFVRRNLAKVAPAEMAAFALGGDAAQVLDVSDVISEWSNADPQSAFDWSSKNLTGRQLSDSLASALGGWTKTDPSAAVSAADSLGPGLRAKLLPDMLDYWGYTDPQAAVAFASQLPAIDRQRATEGAIKGWARKDPAAAAAALASLPPDGLRNAYSEVSWSMTGKNPSQAMAWAVGISDPATAAAMAQNVTESWAEKDAASASASLDTLKPGEFRDKAIVGFVKSVSDLDPESAATWANTIGTEKLRAENVRNAVNIWRAKDREAARAFVNGLKPGPLKEEMQRLVEK